MMSMLNKWDTNMTAVEYDSFTLYRLATVLQELELEEIIIALHLAGVEELEAIDRLFNLPISAYSAARGPL
jgi:hypothetical protein